MAKEDIKKTLTKIVNSEDKTQKGEKSKTLKVADIKTIPIIQIQGQTK